MLRYPSKHEGAQPTQASSFCSAALLLLYMTAPLVTAVPWSIVRAADGLPEPCATDPVYRDFETIQAKAYLDNEDLRFYLSKDFQRELQSRALLELSQRASDKFGSPADYSRQLKENIRGMKLPTCYEAPLHYLVISHYVHDTETARKELNYELKEAPRFGSLPYRRLNAYTFPSSRPSAGIVALNVQSILFFNAISGLAVPALGSTDSTRDKAAIVAQALLAVSYNPEAKAKFAATMVALLEGKGMPRVSVALEEQPWVAFTSGAMARFLVAHEYGHLIRQHTPRERTEAIGGESDHQYQVLMRTWQQEFEADDIGFQLLAHISQRSAGIYPEASRYYLSALSAPFLFFDSLEIFDRVQQMQLNQSTSNLTEEIRQTFRACANGDQVDVMTDRCKEIMDTGHPPAWLRRERLQVVLQKKLGGTDALETALRRNSEFSYVMELFWQETANQLFRAITKKPSPTIQSGPR